jgi:phage tail-like protein
MPEILARSRVSVRLTVDGRDVGGLFREVSGLDSETEVEERQTVDERGRPVIRKVPGVTRFSNIMLRRGIDESRDLWEWRTQAQTARREEEAKADGTIELLDYEGTPIVTYRFAQGWPVRYGVTAGAENEVPEEIIEICVESIERV